MPEGSSSQRGLPSSGLPSVTVIVPTYREALNIPLLLDRIAKVREQHSLELNVLIMDDDSADGSVQAVEAFGEGWVEIVVRTHDRGLSLAVVDGLARATGDVVLIMDADLSHPPEKITDLLTALQAGQQGALGSRYVRGGSTDVQWGIFRWLNSRVATLLARPLTRVHDPMAGFFAMWRRDIAGADLNPVGYKIALELIVRCGVDDIAEIPIHFTDRQYGDSKLSFRQQLLYLLHLRRLYAHKFGR